MNLHRSLFAAAFSVSMFLACSHERAPEESELARSTLGVVATAGGAAGDFDPPRQPPVYENRLVPDVTFLASDDLGGREEGTVGHRVAQEFIVRRLEACGVQPAAGGSYLQEIVGGVGANILGVIPGTDDTLRHRHIVISAHYDHIGECGGAICNGASDNATGVAALIGVACHLASSPMPRSVLVAAWDSEEPPTFLTSQMGSQYYVDHPVVPLAETDVAIVLDLMGSQMWPGFQGHFVLGAELSPEVAAAVDAAPVPDDLPLLRAGLHLAEETWFGHQPWSDYHPFRQAGVPVLFLTDGQNKRYHTPEDDISGIDFSKLEREAKLLFSITAVLARATNTPTFDSQGEDHPREAAAVVTLLEAALEEGGLVDALELDAVVESMLRQDLDEAQRAKQKVDAGEPLTSVDVRALQRGVQRVMCLSAPRPLNACLMI